MFYYYHNIICPVFKGGRPLVDGKPCIIRPIPLLPEPLYVCYGKNWVLLTHFMSHCLA